MKTIRETVLEKNEYIISCRHWLHSHPEKSHEEKQTAAFIASELRKMGLEPVENVGGYGVTAVIEGKPGTKCVGLRADFDALTVTEKTGAPFASEFPGIMHACGHDTHAAMLLGAAAVLTEHKESFAGKVKLIFQPSEEDAAGSGAKAMIAAGCLEAPHVDAIFGQHVWPKVEKGTCGMRKGSQTASSDRFFIDITGKASHAGNAPEKGVDALVIACEIVNALETIVSRNVSALDSAVISIGVLNAGTRYNIVADHAHMEGTCRTMSPAVRKMIPERMRAIVEGIAKAMGGEATLDYRLGFSPVINADSLDEGLHASLSKVFGAENVFYEPQPDLSGEDFSFYGEQIPAYFTHLGCREEGKMTAPLHADTFLPSDEILAKGVEGLAQSAVDYLNA